MKTRAQKEIELKAAEVLLKDSNALAFADFTKVTAEDLRRFRREVKSAGGDFLVIKKRLLNVLLKQKGIDFDARQFKSAVGTVFVESDLEHVSGPIYKFFSNLGDAADKPARALSVQKILGGYDLKSKTAVDHAGMVMLGQLPPREVALAQLLRMFIAPVQAFMYLVNEKAKRSSS